MEEVDSCILGQKGVNCRAFYLQAKPWLGLRGPIFLVLNSHYFSQRDLLRDYKFENQVRYSIEHQNHGKQLGYVYTNVVCK